MDSYRIVECRYLQHVLHFIQKRFMNLDFPRILLTERTVGSFEI